MGQLMSDQGLDGMPVNETLEAEIEKRHAELDKMHDYSQWTKRMEQREEQLYAEIKELNDAYTCWRLSESE
jgi:cell division protein FtsB